jgi:hypothetical protein
MDRTRARERQPAQPHAEKREFLMIVLAAIGAIAALVGFFVVRGKGRTTAGKR